MKNASLARSCIRSPKKKTRTVLKENKDFFDGPGEPAIMPKRNAKVNIHNFIFPFWAVHLLTGACNYFMEHKIIGGFVYVV